MSIVRRNPRDRTQGKGWFELKVKLKVRLEVIVVAAIAIGPLLIALLQR